MIQGSSEIDSYSNLGISTQKIDRDTKFSNTITYLQIMPKEEKNIRDKEPFQYDEIYRIFKHKINIFTVFIPGDIFLAQKIKSEIEHKISGIDVKTTKNLPGLIFTSKDSVHNDLYYNSDKKKMLLSMLENVNESLISRGVSYKIGIAIENSESAHDIITYIKSKTVVLEEREIRVNDLNDLFSFAKSAEGLPIPYKNASKLFWISDKIYRVKPIDTPKPASSGEITIGKYVDSGINELDEPVGIDMPIFNLGTIITGVPGTGKTMAAKQILSQFSNRGNKRLVIISPTSEWNGFCSSSGIKTIDLSDGNIRINLFRCENENITKFYEDLAMLIASSSNAGPYTSSIEKCLLAAFRKSYSSNSDPNPDEVYNEIEEAIIDQHAKRTATSIKYTKHGENIRSSLENLRLILMKSQFAYSGGLSFRKLIKEGIIFDLSKMSNNMKPLFYAFIMNQIYSIADEFDINGDNELRLEICIEEAHLIFNSDDDSAATNDLKQRIQNFRKRGIGLMLITHNVTDIHPSIRRLCQIKLYFRQSSDIAKFAANDMIFQEDDYPKVANILKTLGQRICVTNYIEISNGNKVPSGSMFVKVPSYSEQKIESSKKGKKIIPKSTEIIISEGSDSVKAQHRVELYYLNEKIFSGTITGSLSIPGLLENKNYRFLVIAEKRRDNMEFTIIGGSQNTIMLKSLDKNARVA